MKRKLVILAVFCGVALGGAWLWARERGQSGVEAPGASGWNATCALFVQPGPNLRSGGSKPIQDSRCHGFEGGTCFANPTTTCYLDIDDEYGVSCH